MFGPLLMTIESSVGLVGTIAIGLNILLLGVLILLGKWFARHILDELAAIRELLGEQASDATAHFARNGERIAKLEARIDDFNRFR